MIGRPPSQEAIGDEMQEDRDALLSHYAEMRQSLLSAISGVSENKLSEPSLDGWSVKDHLAHLAFWDDIRADEVERISAGYESAWRMNGEEDETLNQLVHKLRLDWSLEQARWELEVAGQRLARAISNASERGLDRSLYGEAGLTSTHEALHTSWIVRWRREKGL